MAYPEIFQRWPSLSMWWIVESSEAAIAGPAFFGPSRVVRRENGAPIALVFSRPRRPDKWEWDALRAHLDRRRLQGVRQDHTVSNSDPMIC